jgi:hypothetical protein
VKIREIVAEQKGGVTHLCAVETENDFIFMTDLSSNAKKSLRRESFTRCVNEALQFVGKNSEPHRNLSSQSFGKWDGKV